MSADQAPPEYRSVVERGIQLVAREDVFPSVHAVLFDRSQEGRDETLHAWAARTSRRPPLMGRGPAYATSLPGSQLPVIVRHNRHGGLLAPITSDRFLAPTNAPTELAVARRLSAAGVSTVELLGYAVYPAGPLRRADVVTAEIVDSHDLSHFLTASSADERHLAWLATARLVASLTCAGARHHDLNVKNVLLRTAGGTLEAIVLDVDRVEFGRLNDPEITSRNLARLARSARKWRRLHGAHVDESELDALPALVDGLLTQPGGTSPR